MNTELRHHTQELIQSSLDAISHSKEFVGFDIFLLRKFLTEEEQAGLGRDTLSGGELDRLRESAYSRCYQRLKRERPVSRNTLRGWFHLGTAGKPKRIQMFSVAFCLSLSPEELQEYLVMGMQEPGIQINDYQETIFCYGLENGISYQECRDMIEVFEREINRDTVIAQNTHTKELWSMYQENRYLPREEFLLWMCENGCYFKGYSKVALNWFMKLKHEILQFIREEARERLFAALEEHGFFSWALANQIDEEDYGKEIPRFLHNVMRRKDNFTLDENAKEEITRLNWMVYSSREKNSDLLAELYAAALETEDNGISYGKRVYRSRKQFNLPESVYFMTDKYVSQLVGVAQQKEKEIRLSMAKSSLAAMDGREACPEWVRICMESYGVWKNTITVEETLKVLKLVLRHQRQRCQQVKRSDMLILIHYVAQKRYQSYLDRTGEEYVKGDALEGFFSLANEVFGECQMALVDERYQLDYLFIHSFGEEEMYSLSDVIDVSGLEE